MAHLTMMCETYKAHGTPERRIHAFTYDGICAGIVRHLDGRSFPCECECHTTRDGS